MHILGLSNGSINGNSEILLSAVLSSAASTDPSITTSWIHVPSIAIPRNPGPLPGAMDVSVGTNALFAEQKQSQYEADDRRAVLDAILDADALVLATPVYSHQPAGFLKAVFDRIGGPSMDQAFATMALEQKQAGNPKFQNMNPDPRLLKSRIAAFIAVAGSSVPDQITMALPTLHTLVYPLHAKVVDQDVLLGQSAPGSVLVDHGGAAMARAEQMGRNVASQLGKKFDDAQYLGPQRSGACPYCHLAKFEILGGKNEVGCVTCGAKGILRVREDGVVLPEWEQNCRISSNTLAGKITHIDDIAVGGKKVLDEIAADPDFEEKRRRSKECRMPATLLPSQRR